MTDQERQWHRDRCAEYKLEYSIYQTYARTLEQMLRAACRHYAPLAIVQSRPKGFSSYAEKMARKAKKYMALGIGPTDLCGARVIAETLDEVERICAAIRENFEIDEKNSLDVRSRLRTEEFGYLSVHYVVQLKGLQIFDVPAPPEIADRKAEIQVRTLLQHAHASIGHDRLYKTSLKVREDLQREMARLAALLEGSDEAFGKCVRALDSYKQHYGAYMSKKKLEEETAILEMVLANEPDPVQKPVVALRLAQLARASGDYPKVVELLTPFANLQGACAPEVQGEYGHALCRVHVGQPRAKEFQQGCFEIDTALEQAADNLKTRLLGYRAWALSQIPHNETKARDGYRAALDADPENPFHLVSFVEYEIFLGEKLAFLSALAPRFMQAIRKCRGYIDAGIEVPWSFFAMGRLHLFLEQPFESLAAYAKAIQVCLERESTVPLAALETELAFIHRINRGREMPEQHHWVHKVLSLGRAVWADKRSEELVAKHTSFREPVVILAGGTASGFQPNIDRFRKVVIAAFEGFQGTIISGGTNVGIAGLAGEIAAAQKAEKNGTLDVLGYIPRELPYDQPADVRYTELVPSDGQTYGATHVLQYWSDLLLAGIKPQNVRLLGIDGGPIASFEYRLALALGAAVGVMEPATRAAAGLLTNLDWQVCTGLIGLPEDKRSLQAFLQPPRSSLSGEQLEAAAQKIHAAYLEDRHYVHPDAAMRPWETLGEDFRHSNRMQASAVASFMERAGFQLQQVESIVEPLELSEEEVEVLAEMEHGRWVVERLQQNWRYDSVRDTEKKLHPDLVGWDKLPDSVKKWDRNAVRNWPKLLAEAGLALKRTSPLLPVIVREERKRS